MEEKTEKKTPKKTGKRKKNVQLWKTKQEIRK